MLRKSNSSSIQIIIIIIIIIQIKVFSVVCYQWKMHIYFLEVQLRIANVLVGLFLAPLKETKAFIKISRFHTVELNRRAKYLARRHLTRQCGNGRRAKFNEFSSKNLAHRKRWSKAI